MTDEPIQLILLGVNLNTKQVHLQVHHQVPSKCITKLTTGVSGNDFLNLGKGNVSAPSQIFGAGGIRCLGQSPKYNRFWSVPGGQQ